MTWSEAKVLYDGSDDDRDPSIVQRANGTLICNFFSLRKKESANDKEKAWTGLGSWTVVSQDKGRTWSELSPIARDYYCGSPIRELPGGRLILGLYRETEGKS